MDNQDYVIDANGAWGSQREALQWYQQQHAMQQQNLCKTCAHWAVPLKGAQGGDDYIAAVVITPYDIDSGQDMAMPFEVRICAHPAQTRYERPVETNGFGVIDGSEYYARLITAEDFGCVRHGAKT